MTGFLATSDTLALKTNSPICDSSQNPDLTLSSLQINTFCRPVRISKGYSDSFKSMPTLGESSLGHLPTRSSSRHSNITRLTKGSSSPSGSVFVNVVRMKGSTSPPHALLLYIPLHCCLSCSFWVWTRVSLTRCCQARMELLFELRRRALGVRKGLTPATLQNTSSSSGELNEGTAEEKGLKQRL